MQKVEIELRLEENVDLIMTYHYFKALEMFAKNNFFDVMDFHCEKKVDENIVRLSFTHNGKRDNCDDFNESLTF